MLLGRETLKHLKNDLADLRKTLSDKITEIYLLRESIRKEALELYSLQYSNFYTETDLEKINNINNEVNKQTGLDKSRELSVLFEQVDATSESIFSDGVIEWQADLLDELRSLLIQVIQNMLNHFYFNLPGKKSVHEQITAFLNTYPDFSKLFEPKKIFFNSDKDRTELSFSDALIKMPLHELIYYTNQVMQAIEKMGVKNCHLELEKCCDECVGDKKFSDYFGCEKWWRSGGYHWLVVAPSVKDLFDIELKFQEIEGFSKVVNTVSDLKHRVTEQLAIEKSNMEIDLALKKKVEDLKNVLIKVTYAMSQMHVNKMFSQSSLFKVKKFSRPLVSPVEKKEELPVITQPVEIKQPDLNDQLIQLFETLLKDDSIKKFWKRTVYDTWSLYNEVIRIDNISYSVPTGIFLARQEWDKLSITERARVPAKIDLIKNICTVIQSRINNTKKATLITPLYQAISQMLEEDKLVITEEKIAALRGVMRKIMSPVLGLAFDLEMMPLKCSR